MRDRISLDLDELLSKSEKLTRLSDELDWQAQRLKNAARRLEYERQENGSVNEAASDELRRNARLLTRAADDALSLAGCARAAVESFAQCEQQIRRLAMDRYAYELEQS